MCKPVRTQATSGGRKTPSGYAWAVVGTAVLLGAIGILISVVVVIRLFAA